MLVVDIAVMQRADARAVARIGDTELVARAGRGIAEIVRSDARKGKLVAFAGPGNNGGDAFAACAELASEYACTVYAVAASKPSAGRIDAQARAQAAGVRIEAFPQDGAAATQALIDAAIVLDGMLGIGARSDTQAFAHVIDAIAQSRATVYALDVPTGIDANRGTPSVPATLRADVTIALGAPKLGCILEPARAYVGTLWVVDIGIASEEYDREDAYDALTDDEFAALLPRRGAQGDKRSSGAPLIYAGSAQFPGAAILCAHGAARSGAGYVTVATVRDALAPLRAHLVEPIVVGIDDANIQKSIEELIDLARHCRAIAIGPGLGLNDATGAIVRGLIAGTTMPLVIDASGFAHVGKHLEMLRNRACVLTPHENEFARLSGKGSMQTGTRISRLRDFVDKTGITTLLKGATTLIYDGRRMHCNTSGSSALATAGTGDVLTGMIVTLLSQGLSPVDAARIAAYWHGNAGRLAATQRPIGVVAGDIPPLLADASQTRHRRTPNAVQLF